MLPIHDQINVSIMSVPRHKVLVGQWKRYGDYDLRHV